MGNVCVHDSEEFQDVRVRRVSSLGGHEDMVQCETGEDKPLTFNYPCADSKEKLRRKHEIRCPQGHIMRAHVVREMFIVCDQGNVCDECEAEIDREAGSYRCKQCSDWYVLCADCAREALGFSPCEDREVPVVDVMVGDIFLCGPDPNGIHHVVLARGPLEPAEPEYLELLDAVPGHEFYTCQTMESTQSCVGEKTWWYPTKSIFCRDPSNGEVALVADHPPDCNIVSVAMEPVPTKLLLHPLRGSEAEELDEETFQKVIRRAAKKSQQYGKRQAVKSFLCSMMQSGTMVAGQFSTKQAKLDLMERIRDSWDARPICASVAIMCWQRYFDEMYVKDEEAAQRILDVMPHWCNRSTPSLMVKTLTKHGWALLDNFDA